MPHAEYCIFNDGYQFVNAQTLAWCCVQCRRLYLTPMHRSPQDVYTRDKLRCELFLDCEHLNRCLALEQEL